MTHIETLRDMASSSDEEITTNGHAVPIHVDTFRALMGCVDALESLLGKRDVGMMFSDRIRGAENALTMLDGA